MVGAGDAEDEDVGDNKDDDRQEEETGDKRGEEREVEDVVAADVDRCIPVKTVQRRLSQEMPVVLQITPPYRHEYKYFKGKFRFPY